MATALPHRRPNAPNAANAAGAADASTLPITGNGRNTGRLKAVPATKDQREGIHRRVVELCGGLNKSRPLARHEMENHAAGVLAELKLPESYLGWTMVTLASAFWHDQVAAVPHNRRLLLLPDCLRNEKACPAECDATGLLCEDCGACSLSDLRAEAQQKGYKVLIAEGSPAVMKIILGGYVDALVGVACLDVLEKTLDKILLAGIPCMAVPLLNCGCRNTSADEDWIRRMVETPHRPAAVQTRTYMHLMRCAAQMFEPAQLERLVPRARSGPSLVQSNGQGIEGIEPIACTEAIAYDFLAAGGKHSRPFITLAVYDALTGGRATQADGAAHVARLPDTVRRMALAIEAFHKASLVHDDIEDDDSFRYDRPTLHRQYGTATAINVGDYLIGLGYRLVAAGHGTLPSHTPSGDTFSGDTVADILGQFATAHTKLCEGQGAELIWRDAREKRLRPLDALKIYALKTAPAFEAALMAGIRLAGPVEPYRDVAVRFSRHLGVAYQILNDLDDWQEHQPNKRRSGADLLAGRPTVLWALAGQNLDPSARQELDALLDADLTPEAKLARADELYTQADAFRQAAALVSKHHERALAAAEQVEIEPLRRLLHFLADAILDRRSLAISETEMMNDE